MKRYEDLATLIKRRDAWVAEVRNKRSTLRGMAPEIIRALSERIAKLREEERQ